MQTEIKSFTVAGGAAYLASRYVFDASNKKAIAYGIFAGLVIVAALQLNVKIPGVSPAVDRNNSPEVPEADNSRANIAPETLSPISFNSGNTLENSVASHLNPDAVTDWDMAWGDNPYKTQVPTITGI